MTTTADPRSALVRLAAALDPRDHSTTLTNGPGRPPRLTVASRHAQLAEDIYADGDSYFWSWAERLGPVGDPAAAARKITTVLRAAP